MNNKKVFIIRLVLFTIFSCIAPFLFIAFRYDLFRKVSDMSLSGWGLIAILIVFFFAKYVLKMLKLGLPYSMFTQCITGILKVVLPLVILLWCVTAIRNSIDMFIQALGFTIACEIIAIPINPLPKWLESVQMEKMGEKMKKFVELMKGE